DYSYPVDKLLKRGILTDNVLKNTELAKEYANNAGRAIKNYEILSKYFPVDPIMDRELLLEIEPEELRGVIKEIPEGMRTVEEIKEGIKKLRGEKELREEERAIKPEVLEKEFEKLSNKQRDSLVIIKGLCERSRKGEITHYQNRVFREVTSHDLAKVFGTPVLARQIVNQLVDANLIETRRGIHFLPTLTRVVFYSINRNAIKFIEEYEKYLSEIKGIEKDVLKVIRELDLNDDEKRILINIYEGKGLADIRKSLIRSFIRNTLSKFKELGYIRKAGGKWELTYKFEKLLYSLALKKELTEEERELIKGLHGKELPESEERKIKELASSFGLTGVARKVFFGMAKSGLSFFTLEDIEKATGHRVNISKGMWKLHKEGVIEYVGKVRVWSKKTERELRNSGLIKSPFSYHLLPERIKKDINLGLMKEVEVFFRIIELRMMQSDSVITRARIREIIPERQLGTLVTLSRGGYIREVEGGYELSIEEDIREMQGGLEREEKPPRELGGISTSTRIREEIKERFNLDINLRDIYRAEKILAGWGIEVTVDNVMWVFEAEKYLKENTPEGKVIKYLEEQEYSGSDITGRWVGIKVSFSDIRRIIDDVEEKGIIKTEWKEGKRLIIEFHPEKIEGYIWENSSAGRILKSVGRCGLSTKEIVSETGLDPSTIRKWVDMLEGDGWVKIEWGKWHKNKRISLKEREEIIGTGANYNPEEIREYTARVILRDIGILREFPDDKKLRKLVDDTRDLLEYGGILTDEVLKDMELAKRYVENSEKVIKNYEILVDNEILPDPTRDEEILLEVEPEELRGIIDKILYENPEIKKSYEKEELTAEEFNELQEKFLDLIKKEIEKPLWIRNIERYALKKEVISDAAEKLMRVLTTEEYIPGAPGIIVELPPAAKEGLVLNHIVKIVYEYCDARKIKSHEEIMSILENTLRNIVKNPQDFKGVQMIKKYRLTPEGRNALKKNFELRTRFLGQNWLYELNYVLKDEGIFKDVLGHLIEGVGDGLYHGVAHTLASKGYHEGGQVLDFMVDKIRRYCTWRRIEDKRIMKNILRHSLEIVLNNPEDFKDIRTMVKKVKQKYRFRRGTISEDAIVTHLVWNWTEEYTEIYKKVLSDLKLASRAKIRKGDYLLIPSPGRNERIIVDTEKNKLSIIKAGVKKRTFRVETPELENGEPIGLKDISVYTEEGRRVTLREFVMIEFLRRGLYFEIDENLTEAGGLVYVSRDRKTKIHRAECHCQGINKSGLRVVGVPMRDSALREKLSI
ncbi:MAG: hypothetical protein DRO76_05525, partial [Candidatus Altiarchaeales archaeon]